jgi:hypothetical protein
MLVELANQDSNIKSTATPFDYYNEAVVREPVQVTSIKEKSVISAKNLLLALIRPAPTQPRLILPT